MPQNKECQFKSKVNPDHACPEFPLEESNYCIFHKPDKTENEAKLFQKKIEEKLQNEDYAFMGFCFPDRVDFGRQIFAGDDHFEESTSRIADFGGSTFKGDTSFRGSIFKVPAWFKGATFKESAHFGEGTFQQDINFRGSIFKRAAYFENLTFQGAYFHRVTFEGNADFGRSTFESHASFRESVFKVKVHPRYVWFKGVTFEGDADFGRSNFEADVDFRESTFQSNANFQESTFKGNAYFTRSTFRSFATFKRSTFDGDPVFENTTFTTSDFSAEETFRIAKNHYQRQGQYTLAGEYYYKERIARRKQLPRYSPKRWFEYILLDGLSGYGERPLRAIRTGLGVLFGLAFLYWRVGHIYPSPELFNEPHTLTFLDALYFSVVTFTTLDFGDWRPDPSRWIRYVVMSEAFIGAFLMALFIVAFARRMVR